jgi:RNA polymerase sigma factor (sigma-70 family)
MVITAVSSEKRDRLSEFIAAHDQELLRGLRLYASRAGLGAQADLDQIANDLLSEVVIAALDSADRFDTQRHPMSWLLGIGANMIKRRQAEFARRDRREPLIRDLYAGIERQMSEGELFERIAAYADGAGAALETEQFVETTLRHLSPDDREVIQLAVFYDLDSTMLASQLGVNPGAARMRLHRALRRLRTALEVEPQNE